MLGSVGIITKENADTIFYRTNIKYLEENNLINIASPTGEEVIRLSTKGKDYARKYLSDKLYKHRDNQIGHDLKLSKKYLELYNTNKKMAYSWMNESELEDYFGAQGILMQGVDGAYFENGNPEGKLIAVESISKNYSQMKISEKIELMETYFDSYHTV